MKYKLILSLFVLIAFCSCTIPMRLFKPSDFTYQYDGRYTGIDTLICTHGYFQSKLSIGTESLDYRHNVMFYTDGLFCMIGVNEPAKYFIDSNFSPDHLTWGSYKLVGDTIFMQGVKDYGLDGGITIIPLTLQIVTKYKIQDLSRHEREIYEFHPLENRIDSTNWLLKKKWFYKKK